MLKCDVLVEALKGEYNGSYEEFELVLCDAIKKEMIKINDDNNSLCECLVIENLTNQNGELIAGRARNCTEILFNKSIIDDLFNGNRMSLLTLFHELAHIRQNVLIESGSDSSSVIRYIKDALLNHYQELENYRFLGKTYGNSYYRNNYSYNSMEIDAEIEAIYSMITFCDENSIDISDIMNTVEDYFDDLKVRKNKKRYVGDCITFNSYYLTLEEAFDIAINDHAEWLLWYPQLLSEYSIIDGGIVVKNRKDNKKDVVDLYYQPKKIVKEKMFYKVL